MNSIWDCTTYREYLISQMGGEGTRSGKRKELAHQIGVHTTFVSQVLTGRAELSLEQGEAINHYLAHTEDESEFFLQLIMMERAGSAALKRRFKQKVDQLRQERLNIGRRVRAKGSISEKDRERFYSSHIYGAIHVLASIQRFRDAKALSAALHIPVSRARELIDFLVHIGLLSEADGKIKPLSNHVHLSNDSETVLKHHSNWRMHTLNRLRLREPQDLHYSACLSLSRDDAFKIKESLLESLKKNLKVVEASPEETAYVYNMDFYPLVDD